MTEPNMPTPEGEPEHQGFDYCFWSKLLVAIVLFPLVGAIAVFMFTGIVAKIVATAVTIGVLMYAAVKIDQMPCFAGKIPAVIKRK